MVDTKPPEPGNGKRQEVVLFLSSLVPTPKITTNGDFGLEFPVLGYLADRVTKVVVKKFKKKKKQPEAEKLKPHSTDDEEQKEPKSSRTSSDGEKQEELKSNGVLSDDEKQEEAKSKGLTGEDEKQDEPKSNDSANEDEKRDESKSNDPAKDDTKKETPSDKYSRNESDKQLEDSLEDTVQTMKPDITWDKVAGLQNAKSQLQIAAELPQKQPSLFTGNRKASQFILLYGPPGTGKGHLAKALCNSVDSTLFIVSASDMTSKWVGESER